MSVQENQQPQPATRRRLIKSGWTQAQVAEFFAANPPILDGHGNAVRDGNAANDWAEQHGLPKPRSVKKRRRKSRADRRSSGEVDEITISAIYAMKDGVWFENTRHANENGMLSATQLKQRLCWTDTAVSKFASAPDGLGENHKGRLPARYWRLTRIHEIERSEDFTSFAAASAKRRGLSPMDVEASREASDQMMDRIAKQLQDDRNQQAAADTLAAIKQQQDDLLREAELELLSAARPIFRKHEGVWVVRCPEPVEVGDFVEVHRQAGDRSVVKVSQILHSNGGVATFEFTKHTPQDGDTVRTYQ